MANPWRRSARSLGEAYCAEELQGWRRRGISPRERRWGGSPGGGHSAGRSVAGGRFVGGRSRTVGAAGVTRKALWTFLQVRSSPLQQRGALAPTEVAPAVPRAHTAAYSFMRRNANNPSTSAHQAPTATPPEACCLSSGGGLRLYTISIPPGVLHEAYGAKHTMDQGGW